MNKEQVYDEKIAPLMTEIITICQKHGIAMIMDFAIPTPEDQGLACTSLIPGDTGNPKRHRDALEVLKPRPAPVLMMTVTDANGHKTITAIAGD